MALCRSAFLLVYICSSEHDVLRTHISMGLHVFTFDILLSTFIVALQWEVVAHADAVMIPLGAL